MRIRNLLINIFIMVLLTGCDYVPKGSTAFKVPGKTEFDKGELRYYEGSTPVGAPIKLKWYDTNTFIINQELRPGKYEFSARSMQNKGAYKTTLEIVSDQKLYELTENSTAVSKKANNKISGQIKNMPSIKGTVPLHIVFAGENFDTRTTQVGADGKWSAEAPRNANYKISLFTSGDRPLTYSHPTMINLESSSADIGAVALTY